MAKQAVMRVLHNVVTEYPDELKAEILAAVGNLDHIEVWGQEVLVAPFIHPKKSTGGIIMPGMDIYDDKWQSKTFLVLKMGDEAIELAAKKKRGEVVGDWCYGNVQEHWHMSVHGIGARARKDVHGNDMREWGAGWPCRQVLWGDIRGRTTRPQDIM